jgi:hypothetical protein
MFFIRHSCYLILLFKKMFYHFKNKELEEYFVIFKLHVSKALMKFKKNMLTKMLKVLRMFLKLQIGKTDKYYFF